MAKKVILKIVLILLIFTIAIQIFFIKKINAIGISKGKNIAFNIATDREVAERFTLNSEDEIIMEYDAKSGITREIDMKELRKSLEKTRTNKKTNRVEPYDPLANQTYNNRLSTTETTYNPIYDLSDFPARATCRIKADVYGDTLVATGYMAGAKIVVTAAHCVMNLHDNDATFADWIAYPGYQNGSSYKGVYSGWSKIYYSPYWKSTHSPADDWCICILESDIGNTTGWLGTQSYGVNAEMDWLIVRLYGYPFSYGGGEYKRYTQGMTFNTGNYYFTSSAKTTEGFSGGPYVRASDNCVVGICHGYWTDRPNSSVGVRITQNMIDIIIENS